MQYYPSFFLRFVSIYTDFIPFIYVFYDAIFISYFSDTIFFPISVSCSTITVNRCLAAVKTLQVCRDSLKTDLGQIGKIYKIIRCSIGVPVLHANLPVHGARY